MLLNVIGVSAMTVAMGTSASMRASAQDAAQSDATAAEQNAPPTDLGASIRKVTAAPASGGTPTASDNATATATPAPPISAAPGASESMAAPAVMATPVAPPRAKAAKRARSDGAAASAAQGDLSNAKAGSEDSKGQESPFSSLQFSGNKGPINIKSDGLNLDYKANVVTFSGHVNAVQADAILTSDTLTVNYLKDFNQVTSMVADGNVRISQGTRFATGDHGVLDQTKHTVTLTGSPVVHDGEDQVSGSRITCHLDTGKCDVEGARAVFFPQEQKTRDNKDNKKVAKKS